MLEPILFVPDTHRPYHDKRAWRLMMKVAEDLKPKHIIILGDFADFYSVSAHSKSPDRALQLPAELKDVRKGLGDLEDLGAKNNVFIAGNHEDRLTRYLEDKAPELFGVVDIPNVLELDKWEYVPYKEDYQLGKLYATHDVGYAGRYGAQRLLDTYQHCIVGGHTHRLSYIVEGNAAQEAHVAATFGWLGDAQGVDYMRRVKVYRDWALGFGIGFHDTCTGNVHIQPIPIVSKRGTDGPYKVVWNGKEYRA